MTTDMTVYMSNGRQLRRRDRLATVTMDNIVGLLTIITQHSARSRRDRRSLDPGRGLLGSFSSSPVECWGAV